MIFSFSISSHFSRIKKWYQGKYIPPNNDPDSPIVFTFGRTKRPLVARVLSIIGTFWLNHWKFLLTFLLGLATLIVATIAAISGP